MKPKKQTQPVLSLRVQIKRGCVTIHLSVRARWLAAATIALAGLSLGSGMMSRWLEALAQLLK